MPLYEYFCAECSDTFETIRPAAQADAPVVCPRCQASSPQRVLSLVGSSVRKGTARAGAAAAAMATSGMGGACCGGACGCAH